MRQPAPVSSPEATPVPTLAWVDDGPCLLLLDQAELPGRIRQLRIDAVPDLAQAIRRLAVRGAPAIGIAAAYGVALAAIRAARAGHGTDRVQAAATEAMEVLAASRPTAINLFWALARMRAVLAECTAAADRDPGSRLLEEACRIHTADAACCDAMGRYGESLLTDGMRVLTHCNTGRLATGGIGTALGVIKTAARAGKRISVLVDETRPLLQGARLTLFELAEEGIPACLLPDSAAAGLILRGEVDVVLVGADRIAGNGDVANKVGTLALALAASRRRIPFYVVAPTSSIDAAIADGSQIPIEERSPDEVLAALPLAVREQAPQVRNPAFDITPADLVSALVTECGVLPSPSPTSIKALLGSGR